MTEELEAVRERAALLHEQITDLRGEQMEARGLLISVVAFIFLPLTFITGLLGMNVEGIPYAQEPWAFWGVVGVCVAIAPHHLGYFAMATLAERAALTCFLCGGRSARRCSGIIRCPKSRGGRETEPSTRSGLQLDVPVEIVAPAFVQVVGREARPWSCSCQLVGRIGRGGGACAPAPACGRPCAGCRARRRWRHSPRWCGRPGARDDMVEGQLARAPQYWQRSGRAGTG
jgi:hypothetical protein